MFGRRPNSNQAKICVLAFRANRVWLVSSFYIFCFWAIQWSIRSNYITQTRGHKLKLAKHRCRLDMRKFFFPERVVDWWISLDQKTIDQQSINNFKNCLNRQKNIEKDIFMDPWSAKPLPLNKWSVSKYGEVGVATSSELPSELYGRYGRCLF